MCTFQYCLTSFLSITKFVIASFNMNDYHHVTEKKNLPFHSGASENQPELTTSMKTAFHDDQVLN